MTKSAYNETDMDNNSAYPLANMKTAVHFSAKEVYTPFVDFKPRILSASISAIDAEQDMYITGERYKFVIDRESYIIGVVSTNNLNNTEIAKRVSNLCTREQVPVTEFIEPKFKIKAINHFDLENISIDEVIEVLTESGHRHCMVIDREECVVKGVISANDVIKKLNSNLKVYQQ